MIAVPLTIPALLPENAWCTRLITIGSLYGYRQEKLYLMWLKNKNDYEVKVVGKTYDSLRLLFKVRDYFYSRIDKKHFIPKNFCEDHWRGDHRKFDSIAFDQVRQKAYSFNGKTRATAKMQEVNMARVCTIYCRCCTTSETLTWINTKRAPTYLHRCCLTMRPFLSK